MHWQWALCQVNVLLRVQSCFLLWFFTFKCVLLCECDVFSFSHHSYGAQWVLCLFAVLCVIRGPLLFRSDLLSSGYQWIFFVNWCGQMCCYFLFQTIDFKSFEWRVCSQCFSQCSCSFASNKVVCVMVMWLGGWDDLSLFFLTWNAKCCERGVC